MIIGTGFHRKLFAYISPIPDDWSIEPLRKLCENDPEYGITATAVEFKPGMPRFVRITDIDENGELLPTIVGTDSPEANSFLLQEGDFLFARSGSVGKSHLYTASDGLCTFGNYLIRFRPSLSKLYTKYLNAFTRLPIYWRWVTAVARTTTQPNINADEYSELPVLFPALPEQQKIIEIVDVVARSIKAVEEKLAAARRLKTALMQQLFTRGLPGRHTRFQQTKIGEIPEGWELKRLSNVVDGDIYNGVSPQSRPEPPGTPILNVSCISNGRCDLASVTYVDLDGTPPDDLLAKRGDFFVLRGNGNRDYVATGGLLTVEPPKGCIFSDLLIKIPFDKRNSIPGFMPLLWQSQIFLQRLQSKAVSGSGLWKIGLREIRRHVFALPPRPEQEAIVDILLAADESIFAIETELFSIARLKRSLLQNLLTGRIRVKIEP